MSVIVQGGLTVVGKRRELLPNVVVCDRFINGHEVATGYAMDEYQKGVICTFVEMLAGTGTNNGINLLDRFLEDEAQLFILAPTNDNDAYMAGFEIELFSGVKMGEYVNMDESHINVQGALPDANGQYFRLYKKATDYKVAPGYAFTYSQTDCPVGSSYAFGNTTNLNRGIVCLPRATAGGGWSRVGFNGNSDWVLATRRFKGQMGSFQINTGTNIDYTSGDGQRANAYGNYVSVPDNRSDDDVYFHRTNGSSGTPFFPIRLSMYGFGFSFDGIGGIDAYNDFSQAIRWYQENILSNDTRRWI